jgi:heme exporter protein A
VTGSDAAVTAPVMAPREQSEQSAHSAATMIELKRLTKSFGSKMVLRGIDLSVAIGESLVVFGPNGAGKSTLIRILCGLSRASGGTVQIGGLNVTTHSDSVRRYLGVVSHAPLLYDSLTGEENLRFFARLYGLDRAQERIDALLEQVGLAHRRSDLVRTYSRGMVQRLAIARSVLHDPPVLLLDEPDTGLDPQAAEMLHNLLLRLINSSAQVAGAKGSAPSVIGRTIITITHNLERGLAIANRVAILNNGRLAFEANADGLTPADFRPIYDQYVGGGR